MKLKSLIVENFRAVKTLELRLHPQLTVLVGDNAAGKTTLLDAIATGLGAILKRIPETTGIDLKKQDLRQFKGFVFGESRLSMPLQKPHYMRVVLATTETTHLCWDRLLRLDKTEITTQALPTDRYGLKELHDYLDPIIHAVHNDLPAQLPVLAYYSTERAVLSNKLQKNLKRKWTRFNALHSALQKSTQFTKALEWFVDNDSEEARKVRELKNFNYKLPELEAVRQAIKLTIPNCKSVYSKSNPPRLFVDFQNNPQPSVTLELSELSDGYRTMLALVMDLARRMIQANPHLENPLEEEAIVLIDEVDLHLHPKWQQTVLQDITRAFPNTQFIVTTHSPQVLSTVDKDNIWLLNTCKEQGISVSRPFMQPYGSESSNALHSLMEVNPRPQNLEVVKQYERYSLLVENGEYESEEAITLRKQLENILDKSEFDLIDMVIRKHQILGL